MRQIPIDVPAPRIDSGSEKRLRRLLHFPDIFFFRRSAIVLFTGLAHVEEFAVDEGNLPIGETESLAIDQLLQNLQLVYDHGLLVLGVDLLGVLAEDVVVQRVLTTLLGPQIQDRAADLEQVLGNILRFSPELSSIRVDKETLFLLLE